jgi:hypothetical protein
VTGLSISRPTNVERFTRKLLTNNVSGCLLVKTAVTLVQLLSELKPPHYQHTPHSISKSQSCEILEGTFVQCRPFVSGNELGRDSTCRGTSAIIDTSILDTWACSRKGIGWRVGFVENAKSYRARKRWCCLGMLISYRIRELHWRQCSWHNLCLQSWYFFGKLHLHAGMVDPCPDDTASELARACVTSVAMPYLQDLDQYFRRPNSWIAGWMWNYILLIVVLVCCNS